MLKRQRVLASDQLFGRDGSIDRDLDIDDTSLPAAEEAVNAIEAILNTPIPTAPSEELTVQTYLGYAWSHIEAFIARISGLIAEGECVPPGWLDRADAALRSATELDKRAACHFNEGKNTPVEALWSTSLDWDENLEALQVCKERLLSVADRSAFCGEEKLAG